MNLIMSLLRSARREEGQGILEYALLICLVVIVVGGALIYWGQFLHHMFLHYIEVIRAWCGF